MDSQHRLPGCQQHSSLRVGCCGRVLIAKGKHSYGRVRGKVDCYPYETKGRSDCHVTFIDPSEDNIEGKKHQTHKGIVDKVKDMEGSECEESIALEERKPIADSDRGFVLTEKLDFRGEVSSEEYTSNQGGHAADSVEALPFGV
jgi:hypothetical protein